MAGEARTNLVCDLSVACLVDMCLTGTGSGTRVTVEEGCSASLLGEVKLHWAVSITVTSNATIVIHICMKSSECSRAARCTSYR